MALVGLIGAEFAVFVVVIGALLKLGPKFTYLEPRLRDDEDFKRRRDRGFVMVMAVIFGMVVLIDVAIFGGAGRL